MSRAPYLLPRRPHGLEVRRPEGGRCADPRRPVVRVRELADGRGGRAHRGEVRRHRGPTRTASRPRATSGRRRRGSAGRSPPRSCRSRSAAGPKAKTCRKRRGHPPGHDGRGAGEAAAGVPPDGTVTAGNASQLSDGAAAVVVASRPGGRAARGEAAGADRRLRDERRGPEGHLHRPGVGGADGAGEGEADARATSTCSS